MFARFLFFSSKRIIPGDHTHVALAIPRCFLCFKLQARCCTCPNLRNSIFPDGLQVQISPPLGPTDAPSFPLVAPADPHPTSPSSHFFDISGFFVCIFLVCRRL